METALHDLSRGMPYALTIWLALVTLIVVGCGCMVASVLRQGYHRTRARVTQARLRRVRVADELTDLLRYADEVAVAAQRSAVVAAREQAEWEVVRRAREAAWEAYALADARAARALLAQQFPLPALADGWVERRARERYLRRAATEAYRRGDLCVSDLGDILAGRSEWDPRRHPADHEAALLRCARDSRLAAYRAVAEVERTARYHAEVAAAAADSLAMEARAARLRADEVVAARSARRIRRAPASVAPALVARRVPASVAYPVPVVAVEPALAAAR